MKTRIPVFALLVCSLPVPAAAAQALGAQITGWPTLLSGFVLAWVVSAALLWWAAPLDDQAPTAR